MGMLYAKVGGVWVPIAPAGTVGPPAYAGPRTNLASDARFGHLSQATDMGFIARDEGSLGAQILGGKQFFVWDSVAGTFAQFKSPYSNLNGWSMGPHPNATSYQGLWRAGNDTLTDYVVLARSVETILNAPNGAQALRLRYANVDKVNITASNVSINDAKFWAYFNCGTSTTWDTAAIIAEQTNSNNGRIAIYNSSISAYQFRIWPGLNGMDAMNWSCGAFCDLRALSFQVQSTVKSKRAIRPLRVVPETIGPNLDPLSDTVEQPDIMALRPVVFRPRVEPTYPVSDGNGGWVGEPFEEPLHTEGTRERLGLIAEEVQHVIPSAVSGHTEGTGLGIDYAQITVALLDHVQRLTDEVTALRSRVAELEGTP